MSERRWFRFSFKTFLVFVLLRLCLDAADDTMRVMNGSLDSRVPRRRWRQISLRTLLLLFVACPIAAWWWWQRPYEMEVILTDAPLDRPVELAHSGPWPPPNYYQREVRTVRRNQRNQPIQHGPTIAYDRNGAKIAEALWNNGVLDGPYRRWHPDGTRQLEGQYVGGQMHGTWREWVKNGQIEEQYDHGTKVHLVHSINGQKAAESEFKNGKNWRVTVYRPRELLVRTYDENHKVAQRVKWTVDRAVQLESWNYSAGKLHGTQTARHRSGSKQFEYTFADGVPVGVWNWWNEKGDVYRTLEFREGLLVRMDDTWLDELASPPVFTGAGEVIAARLQDITDIDFENAPLREVCDYLATIHEIPIGIDHRALAAEARTEIETITFKLPLVPLGPALQVVLQPRGLTYDYRFGRLWITTLGDRREWTDRTGVPALAQSDDEALRAALSSTTSLEFNDTPLGDVIDFISTSHGIDIRLDEVLERELVSEKCRVTVLEKGFPISVVLSKLLDQLGLMCAKDGDRITVSRLTP